MRAAILRHLISVLLLPFVVTVMIPVGLARRTGHALTLAREPIVMVLQGAGIVVALAGLTLFAASLRRFASDGNGTLAPWDPPRRLVVRGPYRYVRNPMITGVIGVLTGEAMLLRSVPQLGWALAFSTLTVLFILLYEEPALTRKFGDAYREYRAHVPRVIPRVRPWTPPLPRSRGSTMTETHHHMQALTTTPILNVSDIQQSFAWFAKLGWEKLWDWGEPPDFGAVGSGGLEIFLCEDGQGGRGDHGMWIAIAVDNVDETYRRCVEERIEVLSQPQDQPWHVREMCVRHPDGHTFRIGHEIGEATLDDKHGPPLAIERVDVPVRLETRLVAVLRDLAQHKGMSLTSCLEETLLHTFERLGAGVPSPHTREQLVYIQELKKKHGLDYDCHASYRFVEGSRST